MKTRGGSHPATFSQAMELAIANNTGRTTMEGSRGKSAYPADSSKSTHYVQVNIMPIVLIAQLKNTCSSHDATLFIILQSVANHNIVVNSNMTFS